MSARRRTRAGSSALFSMTAALALAGATSCGAERAEPTGPLLVIGVDGVEWDVLLPLIQSGEAPSFRALMERGAFGFLESFRPTESPVIWTTVATGKADAEHGIHSFSYILDDERHLYNSTHRQKPALWNILSQYENTVGCVGWWMTFPVEAINGVMVAQTNTEEQLKSLRSRNVWKGTLRKNTPRQVYPPEREEVILSIVDAVEADLPRITEESFGRFPHPHDRLGERLWSNCQWSLRADTTYFYVVRDLVRDRGPFDMTLVYFGGPDVVGHQFWRYMEPELFDARPSDEEIENYGDIIPDTYRYVDRMIGELVASFPTNTTVMILSDHGMKPFNFGASFDLAQKRESLSSGRHISAPPGILIAAGPGVRHDPALSDIDALVRDDLPRLGSVYDIAPTALALLRIPPGADMPGEIMTNWMTDGEARAARSVGTVESHDALFSPVANTIPFDRAAERERLEQLQNLGYIGDDHEEE